MLSDRGVVYCVTNDRAYLESALTSAMILRSLEPELPISIGSNLPLLHKLSTELALRQHNISTIFLNTPDELADHPFVSRYLKTNLINWSPYQETLFLDADILPCLPIGDLWAYLDQAAIAMVLDRLPLVEMCDHISEQEKSYTLAKIPALSKQFNSGVMLWRNNAETQKLFSQWQREWQVFQKQDQLALVRALHHAQVAVAEIPRTYNGSPRDSVDLIKEGQKIYLLHCWGGMVASGEFRQHAESRYPEIVNRVDLLMSLVHVS